MTEKQIAILFSLGMIAVLFGFAALMLRDYLRFRKVLNERNARLDALEEQIKTSEALRADWDAVTKDLEKVTGIKLK